MQSHLFKIADHKVAIDFVSSDVNNMSLLPSFSTFEWKEDTPEGIDNDTEPMLTLTVDDDLRPSRQRHLVRKFDTGNGDTIVYMLDNGGYQFIIRDIADRDCCLLIADKDFANCKCALNGDWTMRSFGLNNALMLCYAFAGSIKDTLLIHASAVAYDGYGYPFTAQSGTGKSTHTGLWLTNIEGAELINDDNPILRIIDEKPYIYGSPWSGKTPCYRNMRKPLGAMTRIERDSTNHLQRISPVEAFATMLTACSSMKWDTTIYDRLCSTITRLIETTPFFTLYCRPDNEAAILCKETITKRH